MLELNFDTGVVEMSVLGKRTITFNPTDIGFMESLYSMMAKVESIESDVEKKREKTDDPAKFFDYHRLSDKREREAVDSVFGDGFCDDVFGRLRLAALNDEGLMLIERFAFGIIDQMDESVKDTMAKRQDSLSKYTAKYQKYHQK